MKSGSKKMIVTHAHKKHEAPKPTPVDMEKIFIAESKVQKRMGFFVLLALLGVSIAGILLIADLKAHRLTGFAIQDSMASGSVWAVLGILIVVFLFLILRRRKKTVSLYKHK